MKKLTTDPHLDKLILESKATAINHSLWTPDVSMKEVLESVEHCGYLRGLRMAGSIAAYCQAFATDKKSKNLLESLRRAFFQAAEKHLAKDKSTWLCPNPSCSVTVGSHPIPHHPNTCPRCGTLKRI